MADMASVGRAIAVLVMLHGGVPNGDKGDGLTRLAAQDAAQNALGALRRRDEHRQAVDRGVLARSWRALLGDLPGAVCLAVRCLPAHVLAHHTSSTMLTARARLRLISIAP